VTNGHEDVKPVLFGPALQYPAPSYHSCLPATQAKRRTHIQSTSVIPVLSSFAANMQSSLLSTALVQKVRPQRYSCTASRQTESSTKTCVIATAHMLSQAPSSSKCYTSNCSDRVRSVLSGSRSVSVVKPAACSVDDIHQAVSFSQSVANNCSLQTLMPSRTNQMVSPRYSAALFDTNRTDRGLPLAQVYPSRVVTSTAQNTTVETVPSPIHHSEELQRKSPSNSTPLLDRNSPVVCDASSLITVKTSSHVKSSSVLTFASISNNVISPVSVPITSTSVSHTVPILSQNVLSSCSATLPSPVEALSLELCAMKSASDGCVLPPVEISPLSLSDRESIPDEDDSGHELSSSLMEWDDNSMSDIKDFVFETCHMDELSVKRPAFEVIGDCNRTLLRDISQPCYVAAAFDRSLLQSECDHRNFITRTKYYRFFSRKTSAAGSGPHDHDVIQLEKYDLPIVSHSTSQEQRLSASSILKVSEVSNASPSVQCITGKDCSVKDASYIPSKHCSFLKESNCKYGLRDKKANKLQNHQLPHKGSVSNNVIDSVHSSMPKYKLKGDSRDIHSNSLVLMKSESVEEGKPPDILSRTVCLRRRKIIPAAFNSSSEPIDSINEVTSITSDQDRDSCSSAKSHDVKSTEGKRVVCDSADACGKILCKAHCDLMEVNESSSKVNCKKQLLAESAVVSGCGRKNPHGKVSGVRHKNPGDANNNQGEVHRSTTSVSESEHWNVNSRTVATNSVDKLQQNAVTVHTRSSAVWSKSETAASDSHHQINTIAPKTRQKCLKESRHSADDDVLLSRKSDRTVVKQACVTSNTRQKRFCSLRPCTNKQSVAKADLTAKGSKSDSSVNVSDVGDAQSKMRRSILKQLESSEGYVAEKNIRYSKSEDLFDDSSLLSREQRALRVSSFAAYLSFSLSLCCLQ